MNSSYLLLSRLTWINLPAAVLLGLLPRTPVLRTVAAAADRLASAPLGAMLRAATSPRPARFRRARRKVPETMRRLLLALPLGAAILSGGCANSNLVRVKPWERATLTTYALRPDRDPLHTCMVEPTFFSRESAAGGRGVGGSGYGCN